MEASRLKRESRNLGPDMSEVSVKRWEDRMKGRREGKGEGERMGG